jgi:hypothetical protein
MSLSKLERNYLILKATEHVIPQNRKKHHYTSCVCLLNIVESPLLPSSEYYKVVLLLLSL